MKLLPILFLLLSLSNQLFPCTYVQNSFCVSNYTYPEDALIAGKIVQVDSNGIDLEIIEVLSGLEIRDTIRIWDIPDVECNGIWPMSASEMGDLNDSIIVNMSLIDSIKYSWDVLDDYRRPKDLAVTRYLKFSNDSVFGFISGYIYAPYSEQNRSMKYGNFKNFLNDSECQRLVNIQERAKDQSLSYYPNPVQSTLEIHLGEDDKQEKNFEVYALNGKRILSLVSKSEKVQIDFSSFSTGVYLIRIHQKGHAESILKVFKE
ncbi:MAG: T9SS type A sorting domain-containing protein [Chitinophagales bacterium]